MRIHLAFSSLVIAAGVVFACSSTAPSGREGTGSGGTSSVGGPNSGANGQAVTTAGIQVNTTGSNPDCMGDACEQAPPNCGNAELTSDEACDDGNTVSGDGCSANCLQVEEGYSCNPPGQPCRLLAICGDSIRAPSEGCDDGNAVGGDGCNELCKIEDNYKCEVDGMPCVPTTCGDGIKEGSESCDDGNAFPYDGCSANCRAEPDCSGASCASACGDGLLLGEECDDGNTNSGDGCSEYCTIEPGFMCMQQVTEQTDMINGNIVLRV